MAAEGTAPRGVLRGTSTTKRRANAPCSGCGGKRDRPGQAYCRVCHRINMRRQRAEEKARLRAIRDELTRLRKLISKGNAQ